MTSSADPAPAGELAAVRGEFEHFARNRAGEYAPLYARLGAAIAARTDLLELGLRARPGQSRPDLFLAVVQDLLLQEPTHPLARFYPSISSKPDRTDPVPAFLAFVDTHATTIMALMGQRLVQTNEVGRCAFLAPAVRVAAARRRGAPLALLEVGASAGLNLYLDRFGYRYQHGDTGCPDLVVDAPATAPAPALLRCRLDGPGTPPSEALSVAWRAGIDLHPLDIHDAADRRWLHALVWPDHRNRAHMLDTALQAALRSGQRPELHRGDAVDALAGVAAAAPHDAHLVIYHSAVLAHMTEPQRRRFTAALLEVSRHRAVSWVQAEPRLDRDPRRLRLTECQGGDVTADFALGSYHPHGRWLRWE